MVTPCRNEQHKYFFRRTSRPTFVDLADNDSVILFHQNIAGLTNKVARLEVEITYCHPKIICLTETWITDENVYNFINLEGFKVASYYCRKNRIKGGAAILVHNNINFKRIDVEKFCADRVFECAAIMIESEKICIIVIYKVPQDNFVPEFLNRLSDVLQFVTSMLVNLKIVICGDWNINNMVESNDKRRLIEVMSLFGIKSHVHDFTRTTLSTRSGIDYIASNFTENEATIMENCLSDHSAQIINIPFKGTKKEGKKPLSFEKRIYSVENISHFKTLLAKENWFINPNDLFQCQFQSFFTILLKHFEMAFPKRTVKERIYINKEKWINNEVRDLRERLLDLFLSETAK